MKSTSEGEGLSKSDLILQIWAYRPWYMGRIRRWIFNQETAEDIFQDACLKFMSSGAVFVMPQAGTRYFCRILQNLIFEHAKRAARLEYRESLPELVCDPQGGWERDMLLDQVAEAVRHLPADDQRLLTVYLNPECGRLKDKCKILGLPNSTMRYQFKGILGKLRGVVAENS